MHDAEYFIRYDWLMSSLNDRPLVFIRLHHLFCPVGCAFEFSLYQIADIHFVPQHGVDRGDRPQVALDTAAGMTAKAFAALAGLIGRRGRYLQGIQLLGDAAGGHSACVPV